MQLKFGHDDPTYRGAVCSRESQYALTIIVFVCWVITAPWNVIGVSLVAASIFWALETVWNALTIPATFEQAFSIAWPWMPNPRRGQTSTVLQWGMNVLTLDIMMRCSFWLSAGSLWFYVLIGFPVALYITEIIQVAVALRVFGKRPWPKYSSLWARVNGSITLGLWPVWSVLGFVAWFAWPALPELFS